MRLIAIPALLIGLFPAMACAQDSRPLYNSTGSVSAGTPLYNSGTAGVQPLSIKQIMEGKSETGYTYQYDNSTSYRPYAAGSPTFPSLDQVEAFRARQAADAQASEQLAMQDLAQQREQQQLGGGLLDEAAIPGGLQILIPDTLTKKKSRYKGRDLGIEIPPKVFNSVR